MSQQWHIGSVDNDIFRIVWTPHGFLLLACCCTLLLLCLAVVRKRSEEADVERIVSATADTSVPLPRPGGPNIAGVSAADLATAVRWLKQDGVPDEYIGRLLKGRRWIRKSLPGTRLGSALKSLATSSGGIGSAGAMLLRSASLRLGCVSSPPKRVRPRRRLADESGAEKPNSRRAGTGRCFPRARS